METLDQLIRTIASPEGRLGIADVLEAEPWLQAYTGTDWRQFLPTKSPNENQVVLLQNSYCKLSLIYWEPNRKSTKHGHPKRGCLLKILSGSLVETRYDPFDIERVIDRCELGKGAMGYVHDMLAFHIVENPHAHPAVSLHLYAPGIYTPRIISSSRPETEVIGFWEEGRRLVS